MYVQVQCEIIINMQLKNVGKRGKRGWEVGRRLGGGWEEVGLGRLAIT